MKRVAISIGDLNGIGIQLAIENHYTISSIVEPLYCIGGDMLAQATDKLGLKIPDKFTTTSIDASRFSIEGGKIDASSGAYAYASFQKAIQLSKEGKVDAICTLPIHKKAWELAGITYKGHTDALRDAYNKEAIMMLGCPKMYVALFTEHIPIKEVAGKINEKDLTRFLIDLFYALRPTREMGVLGLNPHAGDGGVLGDEEKTIQKAIENANALIGEDSSFKVYSDPLVPDIAFTPKMRARFRYYVAMYHDQGLAPLKALYFDEGINISLNLPMLRTSVDHGTAFDIAYQQQKVNSLSYINAVKYIAEN